MKAQFVYENIHFERRELTPEVLGIGNKKAQAQNRLRIYAEEKGWPIGETKKGIQIITLPLTREVPHNIESSGKIWGDKGSFRADALRYKVAWIDAWEEEGTPLSLRKVYMRNGKETKQNLMGRMPDMQEVIRRIEVNYPKELKKAKGE